MAEGAKRGIPLADVEKYNEEYDEIVISLIKLEKRGMINRQELEQKLVPSVIKAQKSLTNLLARNGIRSESQASDEKKYFSVVTDTLVKI
jgi:hypothetical protein